MVLHLVGQLAAHLLAQGADILVCYIEVDVGPQPTQLDHLAGFIEAVLVLEVVNEIRQLFLGRRRQSLNHLLQFSMFAHPPRPLVCLQVSDSDQAS